MCAQDAAAALSWWPRFVEIVDSQASTAAAAGNTLGLLEQWPPCVFFCPVHRMHGQYHVLAGDQLVIQKPVLLKKKTAKQE